MQKETPTDWYASWFDTPFYHILYKDRDHTEARIFMQRLTSFLKLPEQAEILDLACGKGRHSVTLHELGYRVTGADLSPKSIAFAKRFEEDGLSFQVHDMCEPFGKKFDAVFNLFTSFGYFEDEKDNLRTIKAIKEDLKPAGYGVIDFMNVKKVVRHLVPTETKIVEGITFHINRYVENGYIFKDIAFEDNSQQYTYSERVKALTLSDFTTYFEKAGLELKHCFGDYSLAPFDASTSDRLILIFN